MDRRLTARRSATSRRDLAVATSALAAIAAGASPVGSLLPDIVWSGAIGGLAALAACTSKRTPLLVAAAIAAVGAASMGAGIAALLAVAAAAASTRHVRREAVLARGLAGGAIATSILMSARHQSGWHTMAVAAGAIVLVSGSSLRRASPAGRRAVVRAAVLVSGCLLLATGVAGMAGLASRHAISVGTAEARLGLAAARAGDVDGARAHLERAAARVGEAGDRMARWGVPARVVPGVAQQVAALTAVLDDVESAAGQAGRTARAADVSTLSVHAGRLDLEAVASLRNPFRRLAGTLASLREQIDRRSEGPLVGPIRRQLAELRVEVVRSERDARLGAEAATVLPSALGAERPQRYLVLFTSPSEARGRFGFPGSFAEVTLDQGRIDLGEHGSTSEAFDGFEGTGAGLDLGDPLLRPYVPFGAARELRSATIPPDFTTVARLAASLWEQSGRQPVDGVLRLDPRSLAAVMRFTGPVALPDLPTPLTPENLEEFLLVEQYRQFPFEQAPRRELLETVSEITFERLETADLPPPRQLVDLFGPLVRTGHLEVTSIDRGTSAFLQRIGIVGALPDPTSDALLVSNVNSSGNKIDSFLDRRVRYVGAVRDDELVATVTVELHNAAPAAGLPFYVIGSFTDPPIPPGTNRTTLLVYTAAPATSVAVDGVPVAVRGQLTGGRWLHQLRVDLPPGGTSTVTLDIRGPLPSAGYHLDLVPGGGVRPDLYDVDVQAGGRSARFEGPVEGHRRVAP